MQLSYSVARVNFAPRRAERGRGGACRACAWAPVCRRWRRRCAPSTASAAPLGVLLDYAAGVISASDIRGAGALGAIRYVSDRRPGGAWMLGKPIQLPEARDLYHNGLKIVSCYQYGKQDSADWLGGQNAGVAHAKRGWQLHVAAGGSYGAPIYASIDDDPTYEQYKQQVAPYLRGWEAVLGHQRVGVYANSKTIEWACRRGWAPTSGSTTGDRRGRSPTRPRICIRSRSTSAVRRRGRRGHQPHTPAPVRAVGLNLPTSKSIQQTFCDGRRD